MEKTTAHKIEVLDAVDGLEVRNISKLKTEEAIKKAAADIPELVKKILKYGFKKHILIEGEKGSGKTYSISKFLDQQGMDTVFIAGHEGLLKVA